MFGFFNVNFFVAWFFLDNSFSNRLFSGRLIVGQSLCPNFIGQNFFRRAPVIKGIIINRVNIKRGVFGEIFSQNFFQCVENFIAIIDCKPRDYHAIKRLLNVQKFLERFHKTFAFFIDFPKTADNKILAVNALVDDLERLRQISQPVKAAAVFGFNGVEAQRSCSRQSKFNVVIKKIRILGKSADKTFRVYGENFKEFLSVVLFQIGKEILRQRVKVFKFEELVLLKVALVNQNFCGIFEVTHRKFSVVANHSNRKTIIERAMN